MTIHERIREDLKSAASAVGSSSPASVGAVKRQGLRRRRVRKTAWTLLSAIPVLIFLGFAIPFDPNSTDPAGTHGLETVEVADLAIPVADSEPSLTNPDVWVGLSGPLPRFDTTRLGPDLSFEAGEPEAGDLDERVSKAIYLGELGGEPFYVYSQPAPSIWDRISEMIFGNLSGNTLGTSLSCCSGGDMDHEGGLPGLSRAFATGEPPVIVAEWLGLTPDVSVVAYQADGEFIGWQTPVGGTVSLRLDQDPDEFVMVAFSADGEELSRFDPQALRAVPSTVDDLEERSPDLTGFVSDELEVELSDVQLTQLQDLIEVNVDSRLFEVPIEGQLIYVVVGREEAHLYSQSCEVLASAAIPDGLRAICLERVVNGETETGVFNLHEESE